MASPQPTSVLVVDDEPYLRNTIRVSLTANSFSVEEAGTGGEALLAVRRRLFDVVLLDVNMPEMTGIEACRRIRTACPQTGIIMVTVRDDEEGKIQALHAGADDYVTKPFRVRELLARMRAVLRRTRATAIEAPDILVAGNLRLDLGRRTLRRAGEEIHLSPKEFDLLSFLMKNQGLPLTYVRVLSEVWGPEFCAQMEYLRTYVWVLRKKIESDPGNPQYLLTEPRVGYRFCDPTDSYQARPAFDDE